MNLMWYLGRGGESETKGYKRFKVSAEAYSRQTVSHIINQKKIQLDLITLPLWGIEEVFSVLRRELDSKS